MAAIVRGTKAAGGTNFSTGTILASEVNTDFNTIVNDYNGNITDANIAAGALISTLKIDDTSPNDAAHDDGAVPGDSASQVLPVTLRGEIQQLRYVIQRLALGITTMRLDGTANVDTIGWFDVPQVGPNLIRNGNFAVKTTAAGAAPDGWTLVGTPGTCTTTTTGVTEGHSTARALRIAAAGAALEGIQQTLVGLKASTRYVVGCRAKVNVAADIFRLLTTGAVATAFDDLALDTSSLTYVTVAGVIQTDTTPTDIVVQLLAVADGDSFDVTHCWVRECAIDRIPTGSTPWAYNEVAGTTSLHYVAGGFVDSGLTVDVVCPGPGYQIEVESKCDVKNNSGSNEADITVWSLRQNGTEVDCAYMAPLLTADGSDKATVRFSYVKRDPTPGTTYTYTVFARAPNRDLDRNGSALSTETPRSWIRARAFLESGGG